MLHSISLLDAYCVSHEKGEMLINGCWGEAQLIMLQQNYRPGVVSVVWLLYCRVPSLTWTFLVGMEAPNTSGCYKGIPGVLEQLYRLKPICCRDSWWGKCTRQKKYKPVRGYCRYDSQKQDLGLPTHSLSCSHRPSGCVSGGGGELERGEERQTGQI